MIQLTSISRVARESVKHDILREGVVVSSNGPKDVVIERMFDFLPCDVAPDLNGHVFDAFTIRSNIIGPFEPFMRLNDSTNDKGWLCRAGLAKP